MKILLGDFSAEEGEVFQTNSWEWVCLKLIMVVGLE